MEASIKLPRANVKDQNPHTQKRQIDVKRGNMSMDGSPKQWDKTWLNGCKDNNHEGWKKTRKVFCSLISLT